MHSKIEQRLIELCLARYALVGKQVVFMLSQSTGYHSYYLKLVFRQMYGQLHLVRNKYVYLIWFLPVSIALGNGCIFDLILYGDRHVKCDGEQLSSRLECILNCQQSVCSDRVRITERYRELET